MSGTLLVYAEDYGCLLVEYPQELKRDEIVRTTVGQLPNGEVIVNLYAEAGFGYAYNVSCPECSEWGALP